MIFAGHNAYHYRWLTGMYLPIFCLMFFAPGFLAGRERVTDALPYLTTMLLSSLDQMVLPLGPHSFAFPVTRRRWLATRVAGIVGSAALCLAAWTLGVVTGEASTGRWGVPSGLDGLGWTLGLYLAWALGPYLFTLMTTVPATTMAQFRPVLVVPYFALAFVPWGTLGVWVAASGPWAALGAGLAGLATLAGFGALTLVHLARGDVTG